MSKEIAEEYASSLADLTVNSKPLINMLTILAEENIAHAGVIVETVEKHLEKVHPDIKLPVLYLVDSIIKNVGGAYTQKFSQSIVNMFTRTFKQVDEKVRSQMFKLRETWHDVFPATKLYQLDVKVNLIDPAWPIQAQPQQSNIHVNPNFLKKNAPTTSVTPVLTEEEEKMRSLLAKKEQELLMLQRKKIEIELEQTKRQLEMAEKNAKKVLPVAGMPVAMVNPVVPAAPVELAPVVNVPVKQRLGPPVNKAGGRIAPVSGALAAARRDPRLARRQHANATPASANATPASANATPAPANATQAPTKHPPAVANPPPAPAIAPNVFDIKPLERKTLERNVTKRMNVITIDVRQEADPKPPRDPRRRDPRTGPRRPRPSEPTPAPPPPPQLGPAELAEIKKISDLPPIPKIRRAPEPADPPVAKQKRREDKKKKREAKDKECRDGKDAESSSSSSPEKRARREKREKEAKPSERIPETNDSPVFKELRNFRRDRYRRGRASASPECPERAERPEQAERTERPEPEPERPERAEPAKPEAADAANVPEIVMETKDVDLRVLQPVIPEVKPESITQKRPSTELLDIKAKKTKLDKFDVLFGNEDVDLRQLPQVEEVVPPPPPILTEPLKLDVKPKQDEVALSPQTSPKREHDWEEEVKEKSDDKKKSISIIMQQAKEQYDDGRLDKNQYNTLMYQVLLLNEKLKLKEAKQRESFEASRRKLKAHIREENQKVSPKSNTFGDIDERITPLPVFMDITQESKPNHSQDSDMRMNSMPPLDANDGLRPSLIPMPPAMPIFPPFNPAWRGGSIPRPRMEEFGPRRHRAPVPPFFRKFEKRINPWPPFEPRPIIPPLPTPKLGMSQGENPLLPYERTCTPPPLGAPNVIIPPTDIKILEYIDQDPFKTIQIDGVPREIRFYGDTAVIMLDWDDPREIKFLPGCRRVTFDNKDSVVLSFNEGYKQVEIDDQVFDIKFGAPTRELFINGRWFECFFGDQPMGVLIDGKPRLVHLEGPLPQVDIGKDKRTDLVAGKINLIVDAVNVYPLYLDAKVQKFHVNGTFFTIRFVDCLKTILINEQPFKVEFGDLPKPLYVGNQKHFIRFSALPRYVKPGHIKILNMEGSPLPPAVQPLPRFENIHDQNSVDSGVDSQPLQTKSPSPEPNTESGLNMLASVMPSSMDPAPSSTSEYSSAEPLFLKPEKIPGLDTPNDKKPANAGLPLLGNINVTDLFAKLVATGIVQVPEPKPEPKEEAKSEEVKPKPKEDKNVIHKVDLLKPETLRVAQPGVVSRLYGGMQCSGCGARFPPEHTVRYSQHLDWHFRQNRRDRDSARRAHSRRWHYDLPDWLQFEEVEDLDEREKNWFETGALEEGTASNEAEREVETPSVAAGAPAAHHCALCGDLFQQFYNEDKEEWHLRNSVRHEENNYHPACFEDYKLSLAKEEPKMEETDVVEDTVTIEEPIEIKDVDEEDMNSQSDNESVVEVVEPELPDPEPVEIEEEDDGEEDDVIYKAEPVEEVVVEDECDTDDETTAARRERDLAAIDFAKVKVKLEPIDPDEEPIVSSEPVTVSLDESATAEAAGARGVVSSIDGNVQLEAAPALPPPAATTIRINIAGAAAPAASAPAPAPAPVAAPPPEEDDNDEPLPPGEEPELVYSLKPALEGLRLRKQPPVRKGTELSGLCSIM